jgi:hypothetical protein
MVTVKAHFDGQQIQLDEPIELKLNVKLLVTVLEDGEKAPERPTLLDVIAPLIGTVKGPEDWAEEHDHYLYGTPKRKGRENA